MTDQTVTERRARIGAVAAQVQDAAETAVALLALAAREDGPADLEVCVVGARQCLAEGLSYVDDLA